MTTLQKIRQSLRFIMRKQFFRVWYKIIGRLDKKSEIVFMNFGYEHPDLNLSLEPAEETNRFSINLYHQLIQKQDLHHRSILEVGCGRGGGLAYIKRQFNPARAVGLDLNDQAIDFCKRLYPEEGLEFHAGDAQDLPFEDDSFDLVINVESSHRYDNFRRFIHEVKRILRPGGLFLITDFRRKFQLDTFHNDLVSSNMKILGYDNITANVTRAIELNDPNRRSLINRVAPVFLRKIAFEFAGTKNSDVYRNFVKGRWIYMNYCLQKDK